MILKFEGELKDSLFLFTYATSSERWGDISYQIGKYPIKVYTIDGVLIYQEDEGTTNNGKLPLGGVIVQSSAASSMAISIANPITYYGGSPYTVINQAEHSGDLYDYYWTSYSRGTDGTYNNTKWHNAYLDGYIPLRVKSIYDPCPYLYRIPSNGTWNQFTSNAEWTGYSYTGGISWTINTLGGSWFPGLGLLHAGSSIFERTGDWGIYYSGTTYSQTTGYALSFNTGRGVYPSRNDLVRSYGMSVRCIEVTRRYAHTFCQQKVCKNCRAS